MAKYIAKIKFEGIEEKKVFEAGEEFEMTVKRAEELQKNIDDEYKGFPSLAVNILQRNGKQPFII